MEDESVDVEVTVGLPLFRARYIGWLALESLCNQIDAPRWELIIPEETNINFDPIGEERIRRYYDRLVAANCVSVYYVPLSLWIPLSYKWKLITENSNGKIMLLQAADCYSQPYRIKETYQLMTSKGKDNKVDWCQSKKGYFYSIATENVYIFNAEKIDHPCALNMAYRVDIGKQLPEEEVTKSVDKWLFRSLEHVKGSDLRVKLNRSQHWKKGIDSHGLGNISRMRENSFENSDIWTRCDGVNLEDIIPVEYAFRLKLLKQFIRKYGDYRPWSKLNKEFK